MSVEPRYRLRAFMCEGPCAESCDDLGWSTVNQIFCRRKDKCRYGVVETLNGRFEVWDFFADGWPPTIELGKPLIKPYGSREYPDLDAALMSAALGYRP